MGDPLDWVPASLEGLRAADLLRTVGERGRRRDGHLVDLSSNDYLGLAEDPRLAAAAADAAARWGAGAGASRLIDGGTPPHRQLEQRIAAWKDTEDALVFSSGYLANTGTIPALVGPGDLILSDALNHASIIDGCRLAKAETQVFHHRDLDHLAALLGQGGGRRRVLIVTDGVFSMDGDAADLAGICDLAEAHGAMVMVDDAHGSGVIGPDGRGTAAAQGVAARVHVHLGTLSKAVGAAGGFVAGRSDLIAWLRNAARGFVFDTAPAPAVVAAAATGIELARQEPWRRQRAVELATAIADGLRAARIADVEPPAACVIPIQLGSATDALAASARLARAGLRVVAIRPPTVPPGTARLRVAASAALDDDVVDRLVAALRGVRTTADG